MKKIIIIVTVIVAVLFAFIFNAKEDDKIKRSVYTLLEKETLTDDEKEFVKMAIDPREMKESYVSLDYEHEQLFNKHMDN